MNSIGFTNFRKFVTFPEIPFGDITIMVGGNNAGKSTLVKAMLLMRDFLKSRIESVSNTSIFKSFSPQFSFDAEHVNVGDFYRAFCRQSPHDEDTISFEMKIDKFHFTVNLRGERRPGIIPQVSLIVLADESRDVTFTFDFAKGQMTARFGYDYKALNDDTNAEKIIDRQSVVNELKDRLAESQDLGEISDLKLQIEQLQKEIDLQKQLLDVTIVEEDSATVSMSFFVGDNIGKYVITELIKGFVDYAYVGTLGDKRSKEFKEQEANKSFLRGKEKEITAVAKEIEDVLNRQKIEYIYAHSVSQEPIYSNCIGSSNYVNRTIHEFYNARINEGEEEFEFIEKWLKEFKIGDSLQVISHAGDSYQVFVVDDENPDGMDLADKGMGSIQLVILLLRLATLIRKYKGQVLTVLLEEPEQNLHPALQSKLADLLCFVNKEYGVRFIVETHSEYLIRKSQVIVAEANFADDDELKEKNCFKVYYLPNDGEDPYEMQFTKSGRFTNKFGEGFYDEAGKSNLITLRKEKGLI